MCSLYDKIETLCKSNGVTITDMCRSSGASRGSLSDLKYGRKKTLKPETLVKIAEYFGVSTDYLLGNEKKPTPSVDGSELSENEIEMLRRFRELSETQQDAVLEILKRS